MAHIVIQLGHCYRTSGSTGTNGRDGDPSEQEFATEAGHLTAARLAEVGHTSRVILADVGKDAYRGNAFVAIHCDGSTNPSARGASVGYRTSEGHAFAQSWKAAYNELGWVGFRPDNYTDALAGYYGVKNAVAVGNRFAIIAEAGFLTSPIDEVELSFPHGPERFARAVTAAVVNIFGGILPPEPEPEEESMDLGAFVTCIGEDRGIWWLHGDTFFHLGSTETVGHGTNLGVKTWPWAKADFDRLIKEKGREEELAAFIAERVDNE